MFTTGEKLAMFIFAILLSAGIVAAVYYDSKEAAEFKQSCQQQGGHVTTHSETNLVQTYSADGKAGAGTTTSSTSFCLSADGRVLGIR